MKRTIFLSSMLALTVGGLTGCPGNATNTTVNTNLRTNTTMTNGNMMNGNTANSNVGVVIDSNSNMTGANANMANSMSGATTPSGFMTEAAKGGMAEVEMSKIAQTKAQNAEVKKFAAQMVTDHTKANNELKALAGKKTVTLPTELDAEHKTMAADMSKLSGAEFDRKYVDAMVADHEKDVKLFQAQADGGTDADAKAFAAKTLPTLKMHLDMIKAIQGKMK